MNCLYEIHQCVYPEIITPSTQICSCLKTEIFPSGFAYRPPFFGKTATENTSFKWRALKTLASRLRVDGRKQRFSNTMMSFIVLRMLLRWIKEWVLVTCGVLWLDLVFSSIFLYFNLRPLCLRPEPLWTLNTRFFRSRDQPRP